MDSDEEFEYSGREVQSEIQLAHRFRDPFFERLLFVCVEEYNTR